MSDNELVCNDTYADFTHYIAKSQAAHYSFISSLSGYLYISVQNPYNFPISFNLTATGTLISSQSPYFKYLPFFPCKQTKLILVPLPTLLSLHTHFTLLTTRTTLPFTVHPMAPLTFTCLATQLLRQLSIQFLHHFIFTKHLVFSAKTSISKLRLVLPATLPTMVKRVVFSLFLHLGIWYLGIKSQSNFDAKITPSLQSIFVFSFLLFILSSSFTLWLKFFDDISRN